MPILITFWRVEGEMVLWDRTGSPTDTSVQLPQHLISSPYQLHLGILVIPLLQLLSSFYFLPSHYSSSLIVKCLGFDQVFPKSRTIISIWPNTSSLLHLLILLWSNCACLNIGSSTTSSFLATAPALWSRIEIPPCSSFLLARQRFPIWSEPDIRDFITGTSGQAGEDLLFVTKDSCQRCSLTHSVQSSDLDVDTRYFHLSRLFPQTIILLLVPVSTIQSHRHELLPHHQGQRLGLHWEDTAPSPQQQRRAHLEIEVVEGDWRGTKCWDSSTAHLFPGSVQFVTSWLMPFLRRPEI